jgi:Rod binding domain-containing protein
MEPLKITPSIDSSSARLLKNSVLNAESNSSSLTTEEKIRNAAQGFERTLVRQMLSIVRNSSVRGDDKPNTTSMGYLEILDDKVADQLTAGKGLGFGTQMAEQMIAQIKAKTLNDTPQNAVSNTSSSVSENQ